jgi:Leucine-rich repeat (LRR) protein
MKHIGRQRWFFVLVLTGLTLLSLAVMIQQLSATPRTPGLPEERLSSPTTTITFTGWLSIIWGDGLPGTAPLPPLYRLTLADGRIISLQPATEQLSLFEWAGKQVNVSGEFANGRSGGGEFVVRAVQSLQARGSEDDVFGPQPWVSILCKFADYPDEPKPLNYFEAMYSSEFPGLDHYWREVSYNAINLEGSAAFGWYTLPYTRGYYVLNENPNLGQLFNDCTAAADPFVDYGQFVGINLMFNWDFGAFAYGGQTFAEFDGEARSWRNTWIPPWGFENQSLMDHEMGHGFGLLHSLDPYGYEYGNEWDVMSSIWSNCEASQHPVYGCLGQHTIAFHKERLGWIPAQKQVEVSQGEHVNVTLERLAIPDTENPLMAKILLGGHGTPTYFVVEARSRVAYDVRLWQSAVVIHFTNPYFPQAQAMLSGTLGVGDSYHDIPGQITVTVLSETATGFVVDIEYAAFSCANQADLAVSECEALVDLYNQTNGDNWHNNANWFYGSPCVWFGVTCDNGHVYQLYLYDNNLTGSIPTALTDLPFLETLVIGGNQFGGTLPGWLFTDLPNLRFLDLSQSDLTGALPIITGISSLQAVILYGNELAGSIPPEYGNLLNLTALDLNDNKLTGSIPASLGNLINLQVLHLADNQLSGPVPDELGNLTGLLLLNLSGNQLNGPFPTPVTQMTNLFSLFLNDNEFTGSIPAAIGNLTQLRELAAFNNELNGNLPPELASMANLVVLDLSNNHLTGLLLSTAPPFLSVLRLADNEFTGTIPIALFDSPSYAEIDLSQNHLEGGIPTVISRSLYLGQFDVSQNRLSGNLPAEMGSLIWLYDLDVSDNQFEGYIPAAMTGMLSLTTLDVGYNKLLASDEALLQFLAIHDPDWQATQTAPPSAVRVTNYTTTTAQLNWITIPYTADGGFYEVSYAIAPTGTYTVHGMTADKTVNSYLVDNLQPDTSYYFRVRTFTPAHNGQQSDLWSQYSNRAFIPIEELFLPLIRKP